MKEQKMRNRLTIITACCLIYSCMNTLNAQSVKWLRVGDLQAPISETGSEFEGEFPGTNTSGNFFSWPVKYNIDQTVNRSKTFLIGCKNFFDPVENKLKGVKVIGSALIATADPNQIFPKELKLIGKNYHPVVSVDDRLASALDNYDVLDEVDPNLPCDRMVVVKFNTSMGISVTKKVMAFANSKHGNYFIFDYVFKNTGIIDRAGTVQQPRQTLDSVWVYFFTRYAFGGVTSGGYGSTWGAFSSLWGASDLNHSFGEDPTALEFNDPTSPLYKLRGFYCYYGPTNSTPRSVLSFEQDWGCPKLSDPGAGTLGTAKYAGCSTLHADVSQHNQTDDLSQPRTTISITPDWPCLNNNTSQYDETFMSDRWSVITEGHAIKQHDEIVGNTYPELYVVPRRSYTPYGGDVNTGQGFGPYNGLAPDDSIHIVFVEGVSGLSWEKGREVGANWLQYYNHTGTPQLVLPDGSTTVDPDLYKRKWCETGKDNILQTYRNAKQNYDAGYNVPQPPPPPDHFTVTSGGDKIILEWSNNAVSSAHFDGYVIYRSKGNVLNWMSSYEKIFECSKSNAVQSFDDVTAKRGFDYYYYIQSKDDGTQDGTTLYSSLFWTVTSVPATLQRPAEPPTPFPPDVLTTFWKMLVPYKGAWHADTEYNSSTHDVVSYNRLNYICKAPVADTTKPISDTTHWQLVTSGDSLAFDKGAWITGTGYADTTHDIVSYSGASYICKEAFPRDTLTPDVDQTHWQLLASQGGWISGSHYSAYNVITYSGSSFVTLYAIASGNGLDLVRVVPNPYDVRGRFFQFGDQSQYDRIAFYGLPPIAKLKIFTERGDLIWQKDHTKGTGDELWMSQTSSGQIIASGIYIFYVETPDGRSVFRKFVVIR
jgi:hypothetical protein